MASLSTSVQEMVLGHSGGREIPIQIIHRNEMATCKIKTLTGSGSGSLIKIKDIYCVLTNNHVLSSEEIADGAEAQFEDVDGKPTSVMLIPNTFFITDEALDFSIVALVECPKRSTIATASNGTESIVKEDYEYLEMSGRRPTIGSSLQIIQHPRGGKKKMSSGSVVKISDCKQFVYYNFDTDYGSSGSPVFMDGELVALHHERAPEEKANKGVLMTAILPKLASLHKAQIKKKHSSKAVVS